MLVSYPALTDLHAGHAKVGDRELAQIARASTLEKLFIQANPFSDAGACELGHLVRLRALDVHATRVGDLAMTALSGLPALEELDLAETQVGVLGIRALASARTLRRLGLSWDVSDDVNAAAKLLAGVNHEWNDYHGGGGALWSSNSDGG